MIRIFRHLPALVIILLVAAPAAHGQRRGKGRQTSTPKDSPAAAIVNGQKISYDYYLQRCHDQANQQRKLGYDTAVDLANADAILMELVDQELLRQEAARRKISVTRADAMKMLLDDPPEFIKGPFTDAKGIFYEDTYRSVVQDPTLMAQLVGPDVDKKEVVEKWRNDLDKVITYLQEQELRRRLGETLQAEDPLTPEEIRYRYFAEHTTIVGSFIRVLHSTIPDSLVPVTEEEARAWYDSHREDYSFSSARYVSSLILPVKALHADSLARRTKLDETRSAIAKAPLDRRADVVAELSRGLPENRFPREAISLSSVPPMARAELAAAKRGDVAGPFEIEGEQVLIYVEDTTPVADTVVHARHILIKPGDPTQDSLVHDMMLSLRDSMQTEQEFIKYAGMFGQDGTAQSGGDLGYFGHGEMIREFDSAAFAAPIGKAVGPLKTRFGQHLLWVVERSNHGYRLRELRFPLDVAPEAEESVMQDAMMYADALRKDGAVADSLRREIKLRVPDAISDTSLLRRMDIYGDALAVTNFAFGAQPGEVAVIRLPYDRVAVVQLLQSWPAGVAEYAAIRENYVIPHVRRARQLEMLRPRMQTLADSMTPDMTLGFIRLYAPMAEAFMVQNQVVSPPPDEDKTILDSLITVTPAGSVSGPVRGRHAYYFLRVVDQTLRPSEEDYRRERETFTREYVARYNEELVTDLLKKLREYADITDQRPTSAILARQ